MSLFYYPPPRGWGEGEGGARAMRTHLVTDLGRSGIFAVPDSALLMLATFRAVDAVLAASFLYPRGFASLRSEVK